MATGERWNFFIGFIRDYCIFISHHCRALTSFIENKSTKPATSFVVGFCT